MRRFVGAKQHDRRFLASDRIGRPEAAVVSAPEDAERCSRSDRSGIIGVGRDVREGWRVRRRRKARRFDEHRRELGPRHRAERLETVVADALDDMLRRQRLDAARCPMSGRHVLVAAVECQHGVYAKMVDRRRDDIATGRAADILRRSDARNRINARQRPIRAFPQL